MIESSKVPYIEKGNEFFDEASILNELDLAYKGTSSEHFPKPNDTTIVYNFFMDLENGYMYVANSRIHLYADKTKWAIVFETNGYHTRQSNAHIDLVYVGNCISYPIETYPERSYVSNASSIELITSEEFQRVENKKGKDMEDFELINSDIKEIKVREELIPIDHNKDNYEKRSIIIRDYDNPDQLIDFEGLVRYLSETRNELMSAREEEIREYLPEGLPKLMTIDSFYQESNYEEKFPSSYETYQLIAKILVSKDTRLWRPTKGPNNHWTNWESGSL